MDNQQLFDGLAESLKATYDSSMDIEDGAHQVSELERKSKKASIKSEKYLEQINGRIADIDNGLNVECEDRKAADAENRKYTDKWNKISLTVGLVGVIIGAAGLAVALVALLI